MGLSFFLICSSSYQKNSFAPSVKTNAANNHPNRTSQPIKKTLLSQQISCVLMLCLFNYHGASLQSGGYFDALSPLMAPHCVFCSPESFSSLFIHSSLYLSSVTPILFLSFCASVKATHRRSSPVSTLLQVPISPFDSHSVISPEAPAGLSSVHGRDTLTSSDVVKLHKTVACLHCILGCFCFCLAGYDEVEEIRPVNSERQPIMTLSICTDDILLLSSNTYIRESCLFFSVFGKTKENLAKQLRFQIHNQHPSC